MDSAKAKTLETALKHKKIKGWEIISLIEHGKSAAVFLATKGSERAALKVFDDDLIKKFGDETQLARIDRELELVGQDHPNMVKMIAGGVDGISNNHYLLMEYLDGPNLKQCLQDIPNEKIGLLIEQLADCCRFLEDGGFVHRDIKPENIVVIEDFSRLVLLDFGVVRPIGASDVTDDDGIQHFVGTLRYSSPEFLIRQEGDSKEGWRALTYYQIGGVLHDLLMKSELFSDKSEPYARLVMAVQEDVPSIHNTSVPSYLVDLAKICLCKSPSVRVDMLSWENFKRPSLSVNSSDDAKSRVTSRQTTKTALESAPQEFDTATGTLLHSVLEAIKVKCRGVRNDNTSSLPPISMESSKNKVTVSFGPSPHHDLHSKLSICFEAKILDVKTNIISLSSHAFLNSFDNPPPLPPVRVFKGVFSVNGISKPLESCIYIAFEQAQLSNPNTNTLIFDFNSIKD